jgi:hypothetical protein
MYLLFQRAFDPRVGQHIFRDWAHLRIDGETKRYLSQAGYDTDEHARLFDEILHLVTPLNTWFIFKARRLHHRIINSGRKKSSD